MPVETQPHVVHESATYGGVLINKTKFGRPVTWSDDRTALYVNTSLFPDVDRANMAAVRHLAVYTGLRQGMRIAPEIMSTFIGEHQGATENILRWQGLARLRETDPQLARELPSTLQNPTPTEEFQLAVDTYILTGHFPLELSDAAREAIGKIPQPKGKNLVDLIASGTYLRFDGQNYTKYVQPIVDALAVSDTNPHTSEGFEYRPRLDRDGKTEELREEDIIATVDPFYGGYYREQVVRYIHGQGQVVREPGNKQLISYDNELYDEAVWATQREYITKYDPDHDTRISLPYGGHPIATSLNGAFEFRADDFGTVYVDRQWGRGKEHLPELISFKFVIDKNTENILSDPPIDFETTPWGGPLPAETEAFIELLSKQGWMSDVQRAREVVLYLHKNLSYPETPEETAQMDTNYLPAKDDLWEKISELGIANCYWSNIYRDELCKRLGIPSRIVTGTYVTKDPRFDYAIVDAPGLIKHAWGEVWDGDKQRWTHRGMDATPPKKNKKDKDEDDQHEQQARPEGDFGDQGIVQDEYTTEDITRLYEELLNDTARVTTPQDLAEAKFERDKGLPWKEWHRLQKWIDGVNSTPIPAHSSISRKDSTLYQEWRDLFNLIYKRREIPTEVFKGPVRQSEGDFLDDPVTAYIDIRSQDDDPSGYSVARVRHKERVEVSEFDDDFILDVSGSMSGIPAEEQKKMVLSSQFNIKGLNDRLNYSQYANKMTTPLRVRSRVAVFGDMSTLLHGSDDAITERSLYDLDTTLSEANQSSEGLSTSLRQYLYSIEANPQLAQKIRAGKATKVLTIVSDGSVDYQNECVDLIGQIRKTGVIVQGIGFGRAAQDIRAICHDPNDPDAAVVIDDVRQATSVRHKMLVRHLAKL